MRPLFLASWVVAATAVFSQAHAQTVTPASPPAPRPPEAAGPPASATSQAPAAADGVSTSTTPAAPEFNLSDPLLQAQLPAAKVLSNWQQAITLVRSNSTNLKSALLQIQQAEAQARQALAQSYPSLSANGNISRHLLLGEAAPNPLNPASNGGSIPDPATTWQAGLNLRIPVIAPQAWYDGATAKSAIELAKLSSSETERLLLAGLADAIVNVITSERLLEVSQVSLRSTLSTLELNTRRESLGGGSQVDVLRAEQEVASARAQVIAALEGVQRSREALGLALGSEESYSVAPNIQIDALVSDANAVCHREQNVTQRSDIRVAQSNTELAARRLKSVDYGFYPTLDLVSGATLFGSTNQSPNRERVTWTVAGVLNWTLYDGGARYAGRDVAATQLGLARETLTDTRRKALLQLSQTARAVRVAAANLAVSQKARDISQKSSELSKIAFINGAGTAFDVVDTERRLRSSELDLAIKEFELVKAKITALLAQASCDI